MFKLLNILWLLNDAMNTQEKEKFTNTALDVIIQT